jgi:acyl-coenzyme A thioesterase PaaI-like protein
MHPRTHLGIDSRLCGAAVELAEGRARVVLDAAPQMSADDRGLVHGGFVFGAADYAAMLAVNDPNVVLGAAEVKFVAPMCVGEKAIFDAERVEVSGRKHAITVRGRVAEREIFQGRFVALVLDRHVLDPS